MFKGLETTVETRESLSEFTITELRQELAAAKRDDARGIWSGIKEIEAELAKRAPRQA